MRLFFQRGRSVLLLAWLFVAFFSAAVFAQGLPKIAVYVTGDVADNEKKALGTKMLTSLINSGRYKGIERSSSFLAELEKEQQKQHSGAVDDNQISELGRQFGVKFVCVADITPAFGSFQVSARIVDVETAEVIFIGEGVSPLKTMNDLTLVSDQVVKSMFKEKTVTINQTAYALSTSVSPLDAGLVLRNPDQPNYTVNTNINVKAVPADGYTFIGWTGAVTDTASLIMITMDSDKALMANFQKEVELTAYALSTNVSPLDAGRVLRNPNQSYYILSTNVNVKAVPADGYTFIGWTGAVTDTASLVTITMDSDKALTANFQKEPEPESQHQEPAPTAPESEEKPRIRMSAGIGASVGGHFGGGLKWNNDEVVAMPGSGGGAYLFFDAEYVEAFAGYGVSGGTFKSADISYPRVLPDMQRSYLNVGAFAKYPVAVGMIRVFPLLGFDFEWTVSGKLNADGYEYPFDGIDGRDGADALNTLWFKFGAGVEADLSPSIYLRAELLGGARTASGFEQGQADSHGAETRPVSGITLRAGAGIKL